MTIGQRLCFVMLVLIVGKAEATDRQAPLPDPLRSPFDLAASRALHGKPRKAPACAPSPPAVRDLTFGKFYAAGTGSSIIDPERMKAYQAARAPVDAFEKEIVRRADAYVASAPPSADDARCALAWLAAWADGGAFLGRVSDQGGYNRKWSLCVAATTYLKIRDEPTLDAAARQTVEAWLNRWAVVVREDYSTRNYSTSVLKDVYKRNNHLNWALWCVAAAAAATNEPAGFSWALERYGFALGQIDADGMLPLEIERRAKAMHYHVFAVEPLVMMAELGELNGVALFDSEGGALHRLVKAVTAAFDDRAMFAAKAGYAQDFPDTLGGGQIGWLEVYARRYPAPELARRIEPARPLSHRTIGGNVTVLFSRRALDAR